MEYLGIAPKELKIAVFDFTGCEGCELQFTNREETLVDFLGLVNIRNFREISSEQHDDYEIAFVEGAISRADEIERLQTIRGRATTLIALGSCACFGGVNRMKNACDLNDANRIVYGDLPKETMAVRAVKDVVAVDMEIPGCPVSKDEVERIVQHLAWEMPFQFPVYPVCYECRQHFNICRFELGELCLGPITRGGCKAPCPTGGAGCWGCRGPVQGADVAEFVALVRGKGYSEREIREKVSFFGGFEGLL